MNYDRAVVCVRMVAKDGHQESVAQYPTPLKMSNGNVYKPLTGEVSSYESTSSDSPSVVDISTVHDATFITKEQIASRKWDSAEVYAFLTDWASPVEDEVPLEKFTLGKIVEKDEKFSVELMGINDLLSQNVGRLHQAACGKVFADTHIDGEEVRDSSGYYRCKLNPANFTVTGTITEVTDGGNFRDANRTEEEDWFGNGEIIFTTGKNVGSTRRIVKTHNANGTMVMNYPWYHTPEVGDQYTVIAGCRKRFDEDCGDKFGNKLNFGGKPHAPTGSDVMKVGTPKGDPPVAESISKPFTLS